MYSIKISFPVIIKVLVFSFGIILVNIDIYPLNLNFIQESYGSVC